MPFNIVDPGFRPRLMVDDAEALELVTRACTAAAASGQLPGAAAAPGTHAGGASATAAAVDLEPALTRLCRQHAAGDCVVSVEVSHVQRLWGGMGAVLEAHASTGSGVSAKLIIKHICSWGEMALSFADERKRVSYCCESKFFEALAGELRQAAGCSVPAGLLVDRSSDGTINVVMSKMPGQPYSSTRAAPQEEKAALRAAASGAISDLESEESDEPDNNHDSIGAAETATAVAFLARMHAQTWRPRADAAVAQGLQPQGSYWYLDTRPHELEAMLPKTGWEGRLRRAAKAIDQRLKEDPNQCIIHGDTKADNMSFDDDVVGGVSMCDFQYCGRGNPMKDLAYLLCCAADAGCSAASSEKYLGQYHTHLCTALTGRGAEPPSLVTLQASLDLAYVDLCRWMCGCEAVHPGDDSRGYWGDVSSLQSTVRDVLQRIDGGAEDLGSEEAYREAVWRAFPLPPPHCSAAAEPAAKRRKQGVAAR